MQLIDAIVQNPFTWALFGVYLVGTTFLAWLGHRRTDDIESFALGRGDMHPVIVGITLAASVASAATFVLNPGLVYAFGMSALMHLGVAAALGVLVGLFTLSFGFRRLGAKVKALTVPQWLSERYQSRALGVLFAGINLMSVTFMVLIVVGLAIVMQGTLGLSYTASVVLVICFVFGYVSFGGAYAHAYTNTLQGVVMVVIALIIVGSGIDLLFTGGVTDQLTAQSAALAETVHPASPLYGSTFTVWIAGFVIGFALVCQPHIVTKALYVKSDRDLKRTLIVATVVSIIFSALLLVGLYARLADIPPSAFVDPATGAVRPDAVVTVYIGETFGPVLKSVIAVALLAAGMSTLDGILVALSSIAASDLIAPIANHTVLKNASDETQRRVAHRAGQLVLVALGAITAAIALDPPELASIFGQIGVFGMVASCAVPVALGVFIRKRIPRLLILAVAVASFVTYVSLFGLGQWAQRNAVDLDALAADWGPLGALLSLGGPQLGLMNPAVPATWAIGVGLVVAAVGLAVCRIRSGATESVEKAPVVS